MAETIVSPGVLAIENDQSFITQNPIQAGAAIIGPTPKGKVGIPVLCTTYSDYLNKFGSTFISGSQTYTYLTSISAYNYFNSGGNTLLVTRVVSGTFTPATSSIITEIALTSASLNVDLTYISSSLASVGSQSLNINGITLFYTGSATLPANTSNIIYIGTGSFDASTVADYVSTSSAIFNFSSSIAPYSSSLQFISSSNSSPNLLLTYNSLSSEITNFTPYILTNLALTSASLNVDLTYISASLVSGFSSQSLDINGITLIFTGSNETNTSTQIFINTASFAASTVADYVATSSAIFNFSSSITLYTSSLQFISSSNSSPNLLLTSTTSNGLDGNSFFAIPGSINPGQILSTSSFFGGANQNFFIPTIPVLAIELDKPIPPSGSLNLDQFLIRRYIDNASQNIIEGFRPVGSTGPYLIKPEFVVPELDKDIDEIISLLTEKGLLT